MYALQYGHYQGMPARYTYHVNLHERGTFYADVRDEDGATVYEIRSDDETGEVSQITDGFMRHVKDTDGLRDYLVSLEVLPQNSTLTEV